MSDALEAVRLNSRAKELEAEIRKRRSAPGTLGLSPMLDERRIAGHIPDGAFKLQAAYDRILVWQLPESKSETYEGTGILKTEITKAGEHRQASRGIIVTAGLSALDSLVSNGMNVGHLISFVRLAPWRKEIEQIKGTDLYCLVLRAGDIIASEDTRLALQRGDLNIVAVKNKDGFMEHRYQNKDGSIWAPIAPFSGEDY